MCVIKAEVKYKSVSTVLRNGKNPEAIKTTCPWTKFSCFYCLQKQACQLSTRQREFLIFTMFSFSLLSLPPPPPPAWLPFTCPISSSFLEFQLGAFASENIRAQRKRLHCRLGHFVHTEPLNIFALLRRKYM